MTRKLTSPEKRRLLMAYRKPDRVRQRAWSDFRALVMELVMDGVPQGAIGAHLGVSRQWIHTFTVEDRESDL